MFTVVAKYILLCIDVFTVQLAVHELYCGLRPDSQQIICPTKCQHFWKISQKTVFAICYLSNCNYRIFVKKILLEIGFIEEMRTT